MPASDALFAVADVVKTFGDFAIYHPLTSWLPVGALGAMNAILFKRSGRLLPAIAAHMAYNAVVLLPTFG